MTSGSEKVTRMSGCGLPYFSLKEQNCWLMTFQTISSDAIMAVVSAVREAASYKRILLDRQVFLQRRVCLLRECLIEKVV